jgi:hypothetical protein
VLAAQTLAGAAGDAGAGSSFNIQQPLTPGETQAMPEQVSKIGIDEIFEAAAAGVLRGLKAREISTERLVASGFTVRVDLTAGGPWLQQLSRVALNPQPLPPGESGRSSVE